MSDDSPEVIAVTFQKGGTGKTFTAMNLAGGLAARGFDVLLIDLDPQGTLTANLGHKEQYEANNLSLDEVLLDVNQWGLIGELILCGDEFDFIPANASFTGNRTPLDSADAGETRLGKALSKLEKEYQYIVCDCPPDFSSFAKNGITAGGKVVVPMVPRSEMMHSTKIFFEMCQTLELVYEMNIEYLAFTMTTDNTKRDKKRTMVTEWFVDTFEENGVLIDDRAAFERAKWQGKTIYQHPEAIQTSEFNNFDRVVQLVVQQTTPPAIEDMDIDSVLEMTASDFRDQVIEA